MVTTSKLNEEQVYAFGVYFDYVLARLTAVLEQCAHISPFWYPYVPQQVLVEHIDEFALSCGISLVINHGYRDEESHSFFLPSDCLWSDDFFESLRAQEDTRLEEERLKREANDERRRIDEEERYRELYRVLKKRFEGNAD